MVLMVVYWKKLDVIIFLFLLYKWIDKKFQMLDEYCVNMVSLVIKDNFKFLFDMYELDVLFGYYYIYYIMEYFKKLFLYVDLFFIMGVDLL